MRGDATLELGGRIVAGGRTGKWKIVVNRIIGRVVVSLIWGGTVGAMIVLGLAAVRGYRWDHRGTVRNSLERDPFGQDGPSRLPEDEETRAAVIVDNLGPDLRAAEGFLKMDLPLTVAVLPYRRYTHEVARRAQARGKEVLLHLPLQPRAYPSVDPGAGTLLIGMRREMAEAELSEQIDSVPGCVGVTTYMGSLFTEQLGPMRWVFAVLAERGLLFVDSRTTPNSVAGYVAREFGVPFGTRRIFLNGKGTEASIIRRLCRLVDLAVQEGEVIGIVHASPAAIAALPKVVAAFREKGVRLVPVTRVVSQMTPLGIVYGGENGLPGLGG